MIIQVLLPKRTLSDYESYLNPEIGAQLKELSAKLAGLKVVHINSTSNGGGVVEYLKGLVPILNALGIETSWLVINPSLEFFEVTKTIHNALQGQEVNFDSSAIEIYQKNLKELALELAEINVQADIWVLHDPQTLPLKMLYPKIEKAAWRCHIDTANPNPKVFKFLQPYIASYNSTIFSLPEYANNKIDQSKVVIFPPAIDPLAPHNWPISQTQAQEIIKKFGINIEKPIICQVGRFDPWKDPLGVVDAYRLAKRQIPDLQLVFVTKFADDDPEAHLIYKQLVDYIGGDKDVFIVANPTDNYLTLNAFQTGSDIILQKSIKEGFGLTVAEAMFKGKPVIGGNAGGIKLQIKNGVSGFIVSSSAQASQRIVELFKNPRLAETISENAKRQALNFSVPKLALNYLELFDKIQKTKVRYQDKDEKVISSKQFATLEKDKI